VRTICAIQLGIGCRKINETFRVIFDTLFKRPMYVVLTCSPKPLTVACLAPFSHNTVALV